MWVKIRKRRREGGRRKEGEREKYRTFLEER